MTNYYFLPPTVVEGPAGGGRLFIRFKLFKGITVLRTGGVWSQQRYSSEDIINAADPGYVFKGGYKTYINDTQRADLIAAGYGANIFSE